MPLGESNRYLSVIQKNQFLQHRGISTDNRIDNTPLIKWIAGIGISNDEILRESSSMITQNKFFSFITLLLAGQISLPLFSQEYRSPETVLFRETWGYLLKGEEHYLTGKEPFTDICYFSATFDNGGNLIGNLTPPALSINGEIPFRLHLVISELTNYSRTHYTLKPKSRARKKLISDIVHASKQYDGIQIDFESIPSGDALHFQQFLRDLKKRMPKKILSVALPARRSTSSDAYNYPAIARIVDRVIIMAYDQHYSTSKPGPVAAKSWSRAVAEFAISKIPPKKLIMGLPLYGRAWQEKRYDKALRFSHIENIFSSYNIAKTEDEEYGIRFEFEVPVRVIGYYENAASILAKLKVYASMGITGVSFWRIGQEDKTLWEQIWIQ